MDPYKYVQDFIQKMYDAAQVDSEFGKDSCYCMLDEVAGNVSQQKFAAMFVELGGLECLNVWLQPLPNGKLKRASMILTLLGIINNLEYGEDLWIRSELHNTLLDIEDPTTSKLIQMIVKKFPQ